ncbi:hypothetical protein [Psychrobacter sp. UBA2514]|jgi:hypothetical protein|uniref:hypothetical protein n=1 Tax=Psychrobacter sp. UBA2514 TaxID=1947346 RepID=UPI0025809D72|nr:hypothetical protein [Psychrobacter sp. UBA2514]|tara:strand:+ start:141 stop:974 length:834 start_codon:yes stop_codon:yes gene_type:complete
MNYKKIDYEVVITIIWVVFWLAFLAICFDRSEGIGGIGAFLSGIFAPLALFWFYKSYRIQSSELKLQREELTLQRKALEQSVLAQRGSETALKEQSEALFRQLEIIENQYTDYLKIVNSKRPLFDIVYQRLERERKPFRMEYSSLINSSIRKYDVTRVEYVIVLSNSRANCVVKRILASDEFDTYIKTHTGIELRMDDSEIEKAFQTSAEHITLVCRLSLPPEAKPHEHTEEALNILNGEQIIINYAFDNQYASDTYEFYKDGNDQLKIKLLATDEK